MSELVIPTEKHIPYKCPLCGSLADNVLYIYPVGDRQFPLYRCNVCDGMFIRPMPIELIDDRKMESMEDAEHISPVFKFLHEKLILSKEISIIRSIIRKPEMDLLDIGCGSGWLAHYWQQNGFTVEAVEPSKTRCDFARKNYGLTVHNCYVEELNMVDKYDVIVLRHIVEHLENPAEILSSVSKLLRPDGILLLVVPNLDCIGKKLFGRYWEWVLPWHCNFFTPNSISQLIEKRGFTAVTIYQSPSPLYYAESLGRALGSPAIEQFFMNHRIACLPIALPLTTLGLCIGKSDNLTIMARKDTLMESVKRTG